MKDTSVVVTGDQHARRICSVVKTIFSKRLHGRIGRRGFSFGVLHNAYPTKRTSLLTACSRFEQY